MRPPLHQMDELLKIAQSPKVYIPACIVTAAVLLSVVTQLINRHRLPMLVKFRLMAKKTSLIEIAPCIYKAGQFVVIIGRFTNIFIRPMALRFSEMLKLEKLTGMSGIIVAGSSDHSEAYMNLFDKLSPVETNKFQVFDTESGKIGFGCRKEARKQRFEGVAFVDVNGDVIIGALQIEKYLGM